jgi:hypothetical protein
MQLHSPSTSPPRSSPKEAVPYSTEALRQDLDRVRNAWDDCQARRDRNAITSMPCRAWLPGGPQRDMKLIELAGLCACSGWRYQLGKIRRRHYSVHRRPGEGRQTDEEHKWSRVMRYAAAYKPDSEPPGSVHPAQGRHQRLRCEVHASLSTLDRDHSDAIFDGD